MQRCPSARWVGCRPLSNAEVDRVLAAFAGPAAARDRALFVLGLKAGFRVSELLSLRVGDIVHAGRIAVEEAASGTRGTRLVVALQGNPSDVGPVPNLPNLTGRITQKSRRFSRGSTASAGGRGGTSDST